MLTLTRKTEYALIAVCHLANADQQVVSARDIAEQHGMPLPLLMNVLKKLHQAGHVESVRGAHGGYTLATPSGKLTLNALIEAVEGPVHLVRCTNSDKNGRACTLTVPCPIHRSVRRIHERLREFLSKVTVDDFTFEPGRDARDAAKVGTQ